MAINDAQSGSDQNPEPDRTTPFSSQGSGPQSAPSPSPYPSPYPSAQPQQQPGHGSPYLGSYSSEYPGPYTNPYADPYATEYRPQPGYGAVGTYPPAGSPAPAGRSPRRRRALVGVGGAALAAALVLSGVGIGRATTDGSGTVAQQPAFGNGSSSSGSGSTGSGSGSGNSGNSGNTGQLPGQGVLPGGGQGNSGNGNSGNGNSSQGSGTAASATQQKGIVTITSVLKYENAESAGTGMILSSDGEILTNNHVISGATSITVTDETTGRSYKADVVGTDKSDDVAVIKLRNASGLTTAQVGDASDVSALKVGAAVTGVGNAGGTGSLTAASGKVTALEQSITASDESGSDSEKLTGLIKTDAGIVSGDSGGPLYDSSGDVVGINTAASSGNGSGATSEGYAIPIDDALTIARQIESGVETSSVRIGLPAFIGVGVTDSASGGAGITSVVEGGPAADAGITSGSVITEVGGKSVTNGTSLKKRLAAYDPGQRVAITWTDTSGSSHTKTVTLTSGPAD
ncbi:serine protease, S1-C subfamily, contains C-terminal PDZ domain [Jatrophihabitans endophyticus]|uniref:Serine protease, S1-C subfamily, contains C-terminal PDZ domain n=1 Tax=Jatrophihabitans endophyticus TaxID=1206085 RepID=A0A1M5TR05_9ACTN|nr:trypsin-like peptidase domain-containing protein [Jatrophihabitans endophyticus]SHH53108.1 serine protease, S1-C subfamily, contains C-terminal PDZ domain [Jatrophihabitans endophyticus]